MFASAHAILDLTGQLSEFTTANMLKWIKEARKSGAIIKGDFLKRPQQWANIVCGVPNKVQYVDNILSANFENPSVVTLDYLCNPDTNFHHFVRGWQKGGKCTYDPINYGNQGSNTAKGKNTFIESRRGYQLL